MESLAYTHLSMAYEEANLYPEASEVKLVKDFDCQTKSSFLIRILPSIIAIPIVSTANISLAFPALVRVKNASYCYYPTINPVINKVGGIQSRDHCKKDPEKFKVGTKINLLFCRRDKWCYVNQVDAAPQTEQVWIETKNLCDMYSPKKLGKDDILDNCQENNNVTNWSKLRTDIKESNDLGKRPEQIQSKLSPLWW